LDILLADQALSLRLLLASGYLSLSRSLSQSLLHLVARAPSCPRSLARACIVHHHRRHRSGKTQVHSQAHLVKMLRLQRAAAASSLLLRARAVATLARAWSSCSTNATNATVGMLLAPLHSTHSAAWVLSL